MHTHTYEIPKRHDIDSVAFSIRCRKHKPFSPPRNTSSLALRNISRFFAPPTVFIKRKSKNYPRCNPFASTWYDTYVTHVHICICVCVYIYTYIAFRNASSLALHNIGRCFFVVSSHHRKANKNYPRCNLTSHNYIIWHTHV